jgi:hypothetical protein
MVRDAGIARGSRRTAALLGPGTASLKFFGKNLVPAFNPCLKL